VALADRVAATVVAELCTAVLEAVVAELCTVELEAAARAVVPRIVERQVLQVPVVPLEQRPLPVVAGRVALEVPVARVQVRVARVPP